LLPIARSVLGGREFFPKIHDLFDLHQKPAVDLRGVEDVVDGEVGAEGEADEEDALGVGNGKFSRDQIAQRVR